MKTYKGTQAVASVGKITRWVAYLAVITGVITSIAGLTTNTNAVDWEIVNSGGGLIGTGLSLLILHGILRGLESITQASEIYIEKNEANEHPDSNPKS